MNKSDIAIALMHQYVLFCWKEGEQKGGYNDYVVRTGSIQLATKHIYLNSRVKDWDRRWDRYQIVDMVMNKIVETGRIVLRGSNCVAIKDKDTDPTPDERITLGNINMSRPNVKFSTMYPAIQSLFDKELITISKVGNDYYANVTPLGDKVIQEAMTPENDYKF